MGIQRRARQPARQLSIGRAGLDDTALGHEALNHMWEWLEKDLTLVTLPGVGHNSQHGPIEFMNGLMKTWLQLKTAN